MRVAAHWHATICSRTRVYGDNGVVKINAGASDLQSDALPTELSRPCTVTPNGVILLGFALTKAPMPTETWKTTLRAKPGRNPTFRRVGGGRARTSPPPTAWLFGCSQALSGHVEKFTRRMPPTPGSVRAGRAGCKQHLDAEFSEIIFGDFAPGHWPMTATPVNHLDLHGHARSSVDTHSYALMGTETGRPTKICNIV